MPNDNQKSVTNNQQTQTGSLPPVPTDDMPPIVMEDTTPPMLSTNDLPLANTQTTPETTPTVELPKIDSGSAAPSDDVVMAPVITTQKKKFAGGKVIATILGLFLLVGGLGAGIVLVDQNQNIEEKAYVDPVCYNDCIQTGGTLVCECECGGTNSRCPNESDTDGDNTGNDGDGISTGTDQSRCSQALWCEGCGGFCLSGSYSGGGCNAAQQAMCGETVRYCDDSSKVAYDRDGDGTSDGFYCPDLSDVIPADATKIIYLCSPSKYQQCGDKCDASCYGSILNYVPTNFCGAIQIDQTSNCAGSGNSGDCAHISFFDNDCDTPPGDNPTPTPPSITASCQDVKAYSSTWTLLTEAQLSQLEVGDSVNFCVTGVATGGSFNKAKFTINNIAQAETTTIRPSSTDFCQSYVIPAAVANFNIKAQINHVTLGWK